MKEIKLITSLLFLAFTLSSVEGQAYKDKSNSKELTRNNQTYYFDNIEGVGKSLDKLPRLNCSESDLLKETNSVWMKWRVQEEGLLAFTIAPIIESDDIDFVVFKSDGQKIEAVRCMASGSNLLQDEKLKDNCREITGLNFDSNDYFESEGCSKGDDNFLKYLNIKQGEEYYLLVNNYNSASGFTISFQGNSEFITDEKSRTRRTNEQVNIYPNPSSDYLYLSTNFEITDKLDVKIYNSTGNLISRDRLEPSGNVTKLDIHHLISGTYFLQINQNGQKLTQSFIKS